MTKQGLATGRYNKNGKFITLASGHTVEAKELIMMKRQKMSNEEIIAHLERRDMEVVSAPVKKKAVKAAVPVAKRVHVCTWASVSQEEIVNAIDKNEMPWYKKLLKKGGK